MNDEIREYEEALLNAFADVLRREEMLAQLKQSMEGMKREMELNERSLDAAWQAVGDLLASTGEVEALLPGSGVDYKIYYSAPRESVKVEADAVPDEFCKIERKPKLKEIGDHLRSLRDAGDSLPNWGRLEMGVSKLTWKAIKKGMAA